VSASAANLSINGYTGTITQSAQLTLTGTINMSSGKLLQGAPLLISGTFNLSGGTFVGSSGILTIDVNGSLNLTGGSFTSTDGRLEIAGNFNESGGTFNPNQGEIMLNSTTGTGSPGFGGTTFYDLIINDGLAAYWKLDEASGTSAADSSGYYQTGTLQGSPTWATSSLPSLSFADPSGVTLNGTSQYIDDATPATTTNVAFTACAWAKFSALSGADTLVSETGTNSSAFILRRDSGGKFAFLMTGSDVASPTTYQTLGTTTAVTGTWYHVCGVYNGTTGTLYVNGSAEGTPVTVSNKWLAAGHTYIGADKWAGATADFAPVTIDEVRIYKRVLSAADISRLAAGNQPTGSISTQSPTGGLIVTHDLVIASGTLDTGTDPISVGGSWWNYGGVFTGTGAVSFTGTGTGNFIRASGQPFNPINVTGTGTWTLADALAGSSMTISAGTLAAGANSISVSGNWSNSGTFTGTGTVTLTGTSSAGTLKSGGSSFGALAVSGVSGTYTLQDALAVSGNLSVASGSLTSGSFPVQVGGNVIVNDDVSNGGDPTLVGYWPLDETASPAADSSANGNDLTWTGSPTSATSVPPAITFTDTHSLSMSGTTQYLATSSTLASFAALRPTTVTLSAWYKAKSVDTNGGELISGSNTYGLRITTAGVQVMKRITDNTSTADWIEYRVPEANVLDGNWHQVVGIITTGASGQMSVYFDGVIASGNYWVNGSGGASQLSPSTSPTDSAAALAAIDWDANTETFGLVIGTNPSTTGYHFGGGGSCASQACAIDDVRVYSRALTSAQVAALVHGNQPGGGGGVLSLSGSTTVSGSVSVQSTGTLTLGSGATLALGTATAAGALTLDGTLNSTAGTIKAVSASFPYAFTVGSTASAAPALNVNGLTVKNTDSNGMWINANTSAVTTFTQFDKVAFSNGTSGATTALLNVNASSLYLSSNGCTFDGSTKYAVKLTSTASSGTGPRLLFGNATCATNDASGLCDPVEKLDNDGNNDGVVSPLTGGIVQFIRAAQSDTDGTLVGFPTSAFDWNTFTYYSTYVTFHDGASGSDVIYVRDEAGNPLYSWTDPNLINSTNETIVGTPQWITVGSTHYLYVGINGAAANTGGVYRLVDSGTGTTSGTLTRDTSWPTSGATAGTGYFSCGCTITSALSVDKSNVYWAGTNGAQKLFGITQAAGVAIKAGWPVTTPANVTTSAPTLVTSGTTSLYLATTSTLATLNFATLAWTQDTPVGIGTVNGRLNYGTSLLAATNGTSRLYAGDASGKMWAVNPSSFSGTNSLWSYDASSALSDSSYDARTDTIQFGTSAGKLVALNAGPHTTVNTSYPYSLTSDPISSAPLYFNGVLVVGTTKGNLYFLDRNTGSTTAPNGVAVIKQVSFGPDQSISTIGFDPNYYRYMVATSSSGAKDGRLYYFDLVSDPTSSIQ
jgi:hypothetical protein